MVNDHDHDKDKDKIILLKATECMIRGSDRGLEVRRVSVLPKGARTDAQCT